jgi:uncharacterized protein (DUF1501 family)
MAANKGSKKSFRTSLKGQSKLDGLSRRDFIKQTTCLGSAAAIQSLGLASLLGASKSFASNDYKALVFIFLDGGNDAFNMLVPRGAGQLRTDYELGRGVVALPSNELKAINLAVPATIYGGENYNDFGLHPACGHMADLFNSQAMSVICNIGNLYEPTTRDQFLNGGSILPPQLFSHADQQRKRGPKTGSVGIFFDHTLLVTSQLIEPWFSSLNLHALKTRQASGSLNMAEREGLIQKG